MTTPNRKPTRPRDEQDFVWPPPDEELDRFEMVQIGADPQAPGESVDKSRRSGLRLVFGILPYVLAMVTGATLAEYRLRTTPLTTATVAKASETIVPEPTPPIPGVTMSHPTPPEPGLDQTQVPPKPKLEARPAPPAPASGHGTSLLAAAPRDSAGVPAPLGSGTSRQPTPSLLPLATAPRESANTAAPRTSVAPAMTTIGTIAQPEAMLGAATPLASAAAMAPPSVVPAAVVRPAVVKPPDQQIAIRRTLQVYETAYTRLDAHAAAAVWPSLDVNALSRAFEGLKTQSLAFDRCDFSIGFGTATALCSGSASIVRRVGNPEPLTESRRWTFHLKRIDDHWTIESVSTTR